jgi:RTX calcium-binding nonapeptide repeat (4 copies)/Domain of unknown function (DUF4214)
LLKRFPQALIRNQLTGQDTSETLFLSPTSLYWLVGDIENIQGSKFGDEFYGNELANSIFANAGDDIVDGGLGDDVLAGGEGNDVLVGGEGSDTVVYGGSKTDFSLRSNNLEGYIIEDGNILNGDEGRDELLQVEALQFDDGYVVLYRNSNHLIFFHDNHTYRVLLTALDRQEANTFATAQGGHLATIDSESEGRAIFDYLSGLQLADTAPVAIDFNGLPFVWLGAELSEPANQGTAMALLSWGQGEAGDSVRANAGNVLYSVVEWDETIPLNEPQGLILLVGDATTGQALIAETGSVSDADGIGEFSYQWLRNGEAIPGANDTSYILTINDVGSLIAVELSYTDGAGFNESLVSEARLSTEASSSAYTDLIEMYVIILGRAPAQGGLDFWSSIINQGKSFEYVASEMWGSAGAREFYPDTMTTEDMVVSVYNNILNRDPMEGGKQFWTEQWQRHGPVDTMLDMIDALTANNSADPLAVADKVLFNAKVDVAGYLATLVKNDDIQLASEVFDFLDAGNSVPAAVDYIDQQMAVIGQATGLDGDNLMA